MESAERCFYWKNGVCNYYHQSTMCGGVPPYIQAHSIYGCSDNGLNIVNNCFINKEEAEEKRIEEKSW
jgi:hypothetical protein